MTTRFSHRLKTSLRKVGWRFAPGAMGDRARAWESRYRAEIGLTALARSFVEQNGDRVLHGPMRGLRLPVQRISEIDAPISKLLGSYEAELHAPLEAALTADPELVIDVGAADGYYAVGIALRGRRVVAYDASASAREMCAETARLNGVSLELRGSADVQAFESIPRGALVICDIDGAEERLFTAESARLLRDAVIICELHERAAPGIRHRLESLFSSSHLVEVREARNRNPGDYSELDAFDAGEQDLAINERRYRTDGIAWMIAQPRSRLPA